ncbi:hypothetical protein ACFQLX_06750 [Streptomyces polyrhachis]|uniref:Uncharacterized protein n=1 Tax=Streptomyces polyrhachis TaxID=1282885 RepID=A0ABW2GAN6_9ACTN
MSTEADRVPADHAQQSRPAPAIPAPPPAPDEGVHSAALPPRRPGRAAAALCLLLGLAALTAAALDTWAERGPRVPADVAAYDRVRELWHSEPVDTLLPPVLHGKGSGPGRSDRTWVRVALAPDSPCAAGLDAPLARELAPAGCARLLRATYSDASGSSVITVGLLFAEAGPAPLRRLAARFEREHLGERPGLLPRPYAAPGTPAARFGDRQRAGWTVGVLAGAPVVVYAVSGFADGRVVAHPQPAARAAQAKQTTAVAQSGLGHEALGLAAAVEARLRARIEATAPEEEK